MQLKNDFHLMRFVRFGLIKTTVWIILCYWTTQIVKQKEIRLRFFKNIFHF